MYRFNIMCQNQFALFSIVCKPHSCLWGSASEKKRINKKVCTLTWSPMFECWLQYLTAVWPWVSYCFWVSLATTRNNKKSEKPHRVTVVCRRHNACENILESIIKMIETQYFYIIEEARGYDGFSLTLPWGGWDPWIPIKVDIFWRGESIKILTRLTAEYCYNDQTRLDCKNNMMWKNKDLWKIYRCTEKVSLPTAKTQWTKIGLKSFGWKAHLASFLLLKNDPIKAQF